MYIARVLHAKLGMVADNSSHCGKGLAVLLGIKNLDIHFNKCLFSLLHLLQQLEQRQRTGELGVRRVP